MIVTIILISILSFTLGIFVTIALALWAWHTELQKEELESMSKARRNFIETALKQSFRNKDLTGKEIV